MKAKSLSQAVKALDLGSGYLGYETALPRVSLSTAAATPELLARKGFKATWLAIPEPGQSTQLSWRHEKGYHAHQHGKSWIIHKDSHPPNGLYDVARHVVTEGAPGLGRFVRHTLSGGPSLTKMMNV